MLLKKKDKCPTRITLATNKDISPNQATIPSGQMFTLSD
jgi:hypothetical protein